MVSWKPTVEEGGRDLGHPGSGSSRSANSWICHWSQYQSIWAKHNKRSFVVFRVSYTILFSTGVEFGYTCSWVGQLTFELIWHDWGVKEKKGLKLNFWYSFSHAQLTSRMWNEKKNKYMTSWMSSLQFIRKMIYVGAMHWEVVLLGAVSEV